MVSPRPPSGRFIRHPHRAPATRPVHTTERVVEYAEPRPTETVATVRPVETSERAEWVERVERLDPAETRDDRPTRR